MGGCVIGFPDLISFLTLYSTSLYSPIVPALQYVSLGIEKYGIENVTFIIACYKENDANVTCKDIGDAISSDMSSLTVYINTVKAVCAPIFVVLLGGYSDAVGKKFAINTVLFVNIVWCIVILFNTIFLTGYPSWMYVLANGFILGVNGGSTFTVNNFLTGYLSISTPPSKQTGRFSLLLGFGLLGFVLGPVTSGLVLRVTTKYWIIGALSVSLMFIAMIIGIFCLKPIENKPGIAANVQQTGFFDSFVKAMKFQYHNTIDLFKYQSFLGKFLGANFMYMLGSVGLISPIVVLSQVYLLAAPFKWTTSSRGYFSTGLGLLLVIQSLITVRILKMFHFSRPAIVRVGVFMGFVGTFFLAFASNSPILLIGVGLSSFIVITTPTIQSIILSLVEPEQIGTAVGFMAAMQGFAESALVNIILLVYNKTKHIMNGFCFFTLSFLLGINLVIAMFYTHPQTTREDRNPLTTDDDTPGSPIVPSSDVLKGGVPKASTTPDRFGQSERTSPDNIYAADSLPASEA